MSSTTSTEFTMSAHQLLAWKRAGIALLAVSLPLLVVTREALLRLIEQWWINDGYGHGLVILPAIVYLLWLRKERIVRELPTPSWLGVAALAGVMVGWLGFHIIGVMVAEQIVVVFLLVAIVYAQCGARVSRIVALPLLYLLLAVPFWNVLVPWLQSDTANASAAIVRWLGVPVYLEGVYMSIPDGQFLVADVCAGLRFVLAALSLSGFYSLLNLQRLSTRLTLLVVAFVVSVVFNWIRVASIVLIGHHSQMQSPLVGSHNELGWVLFVGVVAVILVVGRVLERIEESRGEAKGKSSPTLPVVPSVKSVVAICLLCVVAILLPAGAAGYVMRDSARSFQLDTANLAPHSRPVSSVTGQERWQPRYYGSDAELFVHMGPAGEAGIDLYLAYYATQHQDAEVVNDSNDLFDGEVWRRRWGSTKAPVVELGERSSAVEFQIQRLKGRESRLVWRSYWVNDRFVGRRIEAKLLQLAGVFRGQWEAGAVVVSTEVGPSKESVERGRERLRAQLQQALPLIEEVFRSASR
jgi:exosortase A